MSQGRRFLNTLDFLLANAVEKLVEQPVGIAQHCEEKMKHLGQPLIDHVVRLGKKLAPNALREVLLPEGYMMNADNIVDLASGLAQASTLSGNLTPPFKITVPKGTDLNQLVEYNGGTMTLRNRLLQIDNVQSTWVGDNPGVGIESIVK